MEGVLAAFAQFDNDVRSDRTRAGMKEALQRGRWTFLAPLGYLNAPRAMRQSLIPDPERGPIVRRLFKQYASGTYTKQDILRKATQWGLTNRRGQPLTSQAIGMLLRNRLYIGIIDVPDFDVRDRRGDFEPLISEEICNNGPGLSGKVGPLGSQGGKRSIRFGSRTFSADAAVRIQRPNLTSGISRTPSLAARRRT
jgi:hypothetical protein